MQITRLVGLVVMVGAAAFSGCAGLKFYNNPQLEGPETGVKCYSAKPYLLVTQTSTTDKSGDKQTSSIKSEASVILIPDLTNPIYARMKSGYGTANLSLSLEGGMLKSVGQQTDTKIPETITALGSVAAAAGKLAAAAHPPGPPPAKAAPPPPKPEFSLYEINVENGKMVFTKVFPKN